MNRIIDALTVLILITAAAFIGYTLYAAGDAIRRQLFEVTIPIDLNFERMGADDGNVSGGRELHIPQPPMFGGQAQEPATGVGVAATAHREWSREGEFNSFTPDQRGVTSRLPEPDFSAPRPGTETAQLHPEALRFWGGYIYALDKPALILPEPLAALIFCESSNNPGAVGAFQERGLLQISPVHKPRIPRLGYTWDDMFLPEAYVHVASEIFKDQGVAAWSCKP